MRVWAVWAVRLVDLQGPHLMGSAVGLVDPLLLGAQPNMPAHA